MPQYLASTPLQKTFAHHWKTDSLIWSVSSVEEENAANAAACRLMNALQMGGTKDSPDNAGEGHVHSGLPKVQPLLRALKI